MTTSQTSQTEAPQDAQPLTAPEGFNLLADADAGCCGGGACSMPGA